MSSSKITAPAAWVKVVMIAMALAAVFPLPVRAQISRQLFFASSPNPVGSGARAVGRGGAFIAIADDATAASWNPAGLVQLEYPELSAVGSFLMRDESLDFGPGIYNSRDYQSSTTDLNYLSAVYPTEALKIYTVFSLSYQRLYELDRQVQYRFDGVSTGEGATIEEHGVEKNEQFGAFTAISPAVAVEINNRFSLGLTVNLWNDDWSPNRWQQRTRNDHRGLFTSGASSFPFTGRIEAEETFRLVGPNTSFNLGFLWDINNTWRVGGVYKTELVAKVEHEREFFHGTYSSTNPAATTVTHSHESFDETLHLPPAYGIGVAYQPSDELSIAFDLYRTEWDRYILEAEDGHRYNLLTRAARSRETGNVEATVQARLGMEYLIIRGQTVYPLRAGVFYDPEPADGAPQTVCGVSLGGGYVHEPWLIDAALQYRFGQGLKTVIVPDQTSQIDLNETLVMLSVIYHFREKK